MEIDNKKVLEALSHVIEPDLKKDIVKAGLISNLQIDGNKISMVVQVTNPAMHNRKRVKDACIENLNSTFGDDIELNIDMQAVPKAEAEKEPVLPGVANIIAIASGKGGVGKSTITANLAVGLVQQGFKVGLVDADIYGPSIPMMFDIMNEKPVALKEGEGAMMLPVENYGVKVMSIGFFAKSDQAVVWRAPMACNALIQMLGDVEWGELDYMLIDLPPGTGDIHLSLIQNAQLTGAVVVTTPQPVALADARKGVAMFQMDPANVNVLGIVENMAWFTPEELPDNKYYIFGKDGAKELCSQTGIPLLAQIPLVQSIREAGDVGKPVILQEGTPQALAFHNLVQELVKTTKEPATSSVSK